MADLTRGEVQDLIAGFASKNPEYRQALIAKPREVVGAQMGAQIPASVKVTIIEEKPDEFHVILPYVAKEGEELSDADLEAVAGGGKKGGRTSTTYTCDVRSSGFGTHVEVNARVF